MPVPTFEPYEAQSHTVLIDGLETHYLTAGSGSPVVLLHSGEYGSAAELSWEYNIAALASHHTVYAPDWIGFGRTAKVHDFVDFAGFKIAHMAKLCEHLGLVDVPFVGNSMGANLLIRDAAAEAPRFQTSAIVAISGGGAVPANEARAALQDYDCTMEGMRRVVSALFADPIWAEDEDYIRRRYESSLIPGVWECSSAARLRAPIERETAQDRVRRNALDYSGFSAPLLLVAGADDKLKDRGYAFDLAEQIPGSRAIEVEGAAHCAHIERPDVMNEAILDFISSTAK